MKTNAKIFYSLMIAVYMAIATLMFFSVGVITSTLQENEVVGMVESTDRPC